MKYKIEEIIFKDDPLVLNAKSDTVEVLVKNTGDRAVQVCSHFHFFESNSALKFERSKAYGRHLDIPSGTAIRFEPGVERTISLVNYNGTQELYGFDGLVMGSIQDPAIREKALEKGKEIY